ncbi:hypothetical protein BLOT_006739 [Blomia tropicalis]|nr:hypothetical protein BLOT_006739 [Blomia tropicalis]
MMSSISIVFLILFQLMQLKIAMIIPLQPSSYRIMMATCHFEHSLVSISETIDNLTIKLTDNSNGDLLRSLNCTYREKVNRLTNVTSDESPVPILNRLRREIKETVNSVIAAQANESINIDSMYWNQLEMNDSEQWKQKSKEMLLSLPPAWKSMVSNCLEQYRQIQRIIWFEQWLEMQVVNDVQQQQQQQQQHESRSIDDIGNSVLTTLANFFRFVKCVILHTILFLSKAISHLTNNHMVLTICFMFIGLMIIFSFYQRIPSSIVVKM